jgi:outer membrane protein OmpA-like peptidoglycan-associated protein
MKRFTRPGRTRRAVELWQLVYMDMMTNVTIFFVILWTLSQVKEHGLSQTIGEQTVRMVNLPGDVLFPSGQSKLSPGGASVFEQLFAKDAKTVLNFETGGLVKRVLVIHGHTDGDGDKDKNFDLGFKRAYSVFKEIQKYGPQLIEHVVLCSHADNTPQQAVPTFQGETTPAQREALREAKSKNRRITIEDALVNLSGSE